MKSSVSARLNADILEEKYAQWSKDPQSVEATWAAFFEGFELGTVQPPKKPGSKAEAVSAAPTPSGDPQAELSFFGKVVSLVYNYRTLGHTQADINPLGPPERNPRLQLDQFGIADSDLEREAANRFFRNGERMKLR
ncbi:MAG: 2-oxoglutarate dehydrogenase E1 subunit family protein, partial [Haloferula sp.]